MTHVSAWKADLLRLGALDAAESARLREHLASCDACRHAEDEAVKSHAHFAQYVAPRGAPTRRRWLPAWLFVPATAFALLLFLLWPHAPMPDDLGTLGVKGGPVLRTFVRHGAEVAPLKDGQALRAGDELRFVVVSETLPYVLVCSVDGAGKANIYFPFDGTQSGAIALKQRVELPGSVVLDDAAGPERVFALFSKTPISASDAATALTQLGDADAIRAAKHVAIASDAQLTVWFDKAP